MSCCGHLTSRVGLSAEAKNRIWIRIAQKAWSLCVMQTFASTTFKILLCGRENLQESTVFRLMAAG